MTFSEAEPGQAKVLVIGIGNPARCDDGVGIVVARALAAKRLPNASVVESVGEAAALSQLWTGAETVFVVDAVSSDAEPGTVHRIDARTRSLPTGIFQSSSHNFGIAEAVELARAMNQLPTRLIVYGIEGKHFETGIGLSPEVVSAARRVVGSIARELRGRRRHPPRAKRRASVSVPSAGE